MEHVLKEKEECRLRDHDLPRRARHLIGAHAKELGDWVEEENLSESSLADQHQLDQTNGTLTAAPS